MQVYNGPRPTTNLLHAGVSPGMSDAMHSESSAGEADWLFPTPSETSGWVMRVTKSGRSIGNAKERPLERSTGRLPQTSGVIFRLPEPQTKAIWVQKVSAPAARRFANRSNDGDTLGSKVGHNIINTPIRHGEDDRGCVAAHAFLLEEDDFQAPFKIALKPEGLRALHPF